MKRRALILVTSRAAREIREAARWWRENRSAAPQAFSQALASAYEALAAQPLAGTIAEDLRLEGVRRLVLHRLRYDLYYRVSTDRSAIEILALWHTSRDPDRLGL